MNALDALTVRRLAAELKRNCKEFADWFIMDTDRDAERIHQQIKASFDQYLDRLAAQRILEPLSNEVTTSIVDSWDAKSSRCRTRLTYHLSNKTDHKVRRKFYSRRTARVYAKRNAPHVVFVDMSFVPYRILTDPVTINVSFGSETIQPEE